FADKPRAVSGFGPHTLGQQHVRDGSLQHLPLFGEGSAPQGRRVPQFCDEVCVFRTCHMSEIPQIHFRSCISILAFPPCVQARARLFPPTLPTSQGSRRVHPTGSVHVLGS